MYFRTRRHWNKTYQKNILSFREHVSVRNNISIVAVNYYYYFIAGNQVFSERSTPKWFQLRKAEKSGRHCECFKFLVFLKFNLFQTPFLTMHHDSSSLCALKYNVLFLREEQTSFVYLYNNFLEALLWHYKIQIYQGLDKTSEFCLKGAWGSLFMYYTFQIKLLFSDKKHLHPDVQIHDFVF